MRYQLGCNLSYNILADRPSSSTSRSRGLRGIEILVEELTPSPDLKRDVYVTPDARNRYLGVLVPPGPFSLDLQGRGDARRASRRSGRRARVPVAELPLDIMPFLLPCRFVSSDRLAAFAHARVRHAAEGPRARHRDLQLDLRQPRPTSAAPPTSRPRRTRACCSAPASAATSRISASPSAARWIPARFVSCYAYGLQPSRLPRRVRSLSRRPLVAVRRHAPGRSRRARAHRRRPRRRRDRLRDALRRHAAGRPQIRSSAPTARPSAGPRTVDAISTEEPAPHAGAA